MSEVVAPGHPQPRGAGHNPDRQTVLYCPYCAEETLFPLERGWECRSCWRAFSVAFLGLASPDGPPLQTREHTQ